MRYLHSQPNSDIQQCSNSSVTICVTFLDFYIFLTQVLCCCVCCIQFLPTFPGTYLDKQLQSLNQAAVSECPFVPHKCNNASWIFAFLCPACVVEQGSCQCCLMLQEIGKMRTHFNNSLNELEEIYLQTKQSLNIVKGRFKGHSSKVLLCRTITYVRLLLMWIDRFTWNCIALLFFF